MDIPFTIDQFLEVFRQYNRSVWPAPVIGYIVAALSLIAVQRGFPRGSRFAFAVLAAFWVWTGIFYHIIFFGKVNSLAPIFGTLYVIQGLILFVFGVMRNDLRLEFGRGFQSVAGSVFIAYAALFYGLLAMALGHWYPEMPVFPIAPCPLTIYTFGLFLLASGKVRWYLWTIPLIWSLIGFTAALKLGMYEDYGLLVAGVIGTVMIVRHNRRLSGNFVTQG